MNLKLLTMEFDNLGYSLIFILIFTALLIIFKIKPLERKIKLSDLSQYITKTKREKILGKQLSKKEQITVKIEAMLKRMKKGLYFFYFLIGIAFILGIFIGNLLFDDLFLALVTGLCFLPLPYLYLHIKTNWYIRHETEKLENTMSIITNAYIGCDDIQKAFEIYVQEEQRHSSEKTAFVQFVTEILYINPNIERGLVILSEKVDNPHFAQWTKMLILCHYDRRLKFALRPIIDSMNDTKSIQCENETVMLQTWREYFMTVILMFSVIPILRVANDEWFKILTQTIIGKALLILMLIMALVSAFIVMKINKPVM